MVIDVLLRKTKAKLEENKKIKDYFLRNCKRGCSQSEKSERRKLANLCDNIKKMEHLLLLVKNKSSHP